LLECEAFIATLTTRDGRRRMQTTVVAVVCHTIGAVTPQSVSNLPDPVCREVIVVKDDMPMRACMLLQPALADRKEIYRGDSWWISRIKCMPGDYVLKERI
jgi:hypothetical protein